MKLNRKNKLLLLGFVLLIALSYHFAVSNTIGYFREYHAKSEQLGQGISSGRQLVPLSEKERQLDNLLKNYNVGNPETFQNDLLRELSQCSKTHHLKITDFKEPHLTISGSIVTANYLFTLEGSFNGLLLVLNKLENKSEMGTIKHVRFLKKRNFKTNSDQIFMEAILQKNKN